MIVIDVGCARHGDDYSIERLIDEFQPRLLIGLDPLWQEGLTVQTLGATRIMVLRLAAWTFDGTVGFAGAGLTGHVHPVGEPVGCVDLATLVGGLLPEEIVLKVDAEGAEYDLLLHLIAHGVSARLRLALVEWHGDGPGPRDQRQVIERALGCELREWAW